jgi:hypothetical protein
MNWWSKPVIRLAACAIIGIVALSPSASAQDGKAAGSAPAAGAKAEAAKPNAPEEPKDMVRLFKGNSLDGWDYDGRLWRVEDGVVIGQTTEDKPAKGNTFLIWKGGELKDFELRCSFRIRGGNSGIQYRSTHVKTGNAPNNWVVRGYQAEVENTPGKVGFIYHEGGPGKGRGYPDAGNYLCKVGDKVVIDEAGKSNVVGSLGDKAAIAAAYKPGDWNDYVIIARGNHIRQYINGVQTADLTDNDEKNRLTSGVLALQIHAGNPMTVEFKDLRLKQFQKEKEAEK